MRYAIIEPSSICHICYPSTKVTYSAKRANDAGADDYLDKGSYDARGLVAALLRSVQRTCASARSRQVQELATSLVADG